MGFNNGFVASIIVDGRPLREFNENGKRTARMPFGTEYKLKLKNTKFSRAIAKVYIDDTKMGDDLVLGPKETIDLERYIGKGDGRKFKFVSLEQGMKDGSIQDPTNQLNGCIRVEFFEESTPCYQIYTNGGLEDLGRKTFTGERRVSFNTPVSNGFTQSTINNFFVSEEKGATVEGSASDQHFITTTGFETETVPTVVEIWLKGEQPESKGWKMSKGNVYFNGQVLGFIEHLEIIPSKDSEGKVRLTIDASHFS